MTAGLGFLILGSAFVLLTDGLAGLWIGLVLHCRYFQHQHWTKIALLSPIDATGQDGEHVLTDTLMLPENRSAALVANEHYAPADMSVTAQLVRIKHTDP